MQRCGNCGAHRWDPVPVCYHCNSLTWEWDELPGTGTVFTYTLNSQKFHPDQEPPDLIAIVVLDEQDDLRVVTDLVETTIEDVSIGMPVEVLFERHGEIYYPIFRPIFRPVGGGS